MIQKADLNDIEAIYSLYSSVALDVSKIYNNEYISAVQKNGFIVALEEKKDIEQRIINDTLFVVFKENNNVLGFLNVNKEIYFPQDADNIFWFDKTLKNKYFHSNQSIELHEIIVDKNHLHQGIARQLLDYSCRELKKKDIKFLFSIVTLDRLQIALQYYFIQEILLKGLVSRCPLIYSD